MGHSDIVELLATLIERGVEIAPTLQGDTEASSVEAADELGYPVVLKAGGLLHKSDRNGVVTDLRTRDDVQAAAHDLRARLGPGATPLIVQPMYSGQEILVGLSCEPGLGTLVVVGAGGIHAEVLGDTASMLAPIDIDAAQHLIRQLRCYPILRGHRGSPPFDVNALANIVARVSELPARFPTLREMDINPVILREGEAGAVCVDIRAVFDDRAPVSSASATAPRDLSAILEPKSVAVVGVSDRNDKVGSRIFEYLLKHGFSGPAYPVHPSGGQVHGLRRYRSLAELPETPDLVSVAVPASAAAGVVREAVEAGARGVIVHASGFAESGDAGATRQDSLVSIARAAGIPVAGPNSMGIVSPGRRLALSLGGALELPEIKAGSIGLVSSSGALGSCIASRLLHSPALSRWIHLGNEADLSAADFLEWLATDPATKVVGLILENITHGERFVRAGQALAAAGKPVFVYNMARSRSGREAAQSHTGALVGSLHIREAMIDAAGMVRVGSLQTFEDVLLLTSSSGVPAGNRLAAITASGGACTIIADEAEALGLRLPQPSERCQERVRRGLPEFVQVRNPLDVSAEVARDPRGLTGALTEFLKDESYDCVLVQLTTNADPAAARIAEAIVQVRADARIPIYVARFGAQRLAPQATEIYDKHGVPVLDAPDRSVRAIAALIRSAAAMRPRRME